MGIIAILTAIFNAINKFFSVLYFYSPGFNIISLLKTKKFAPAKKYHKYAILIAARNEEKVIGNLIDSINNQDYPSEYITTIVVADNCTDNTAKICREHGAVCYERFDDAHRTKGYALQFLFEKIREDFGIESYEAYFIFDADNLLNPDYISRMNDAFDSGEQVVTSYRNTKNFNSNWIASGYAIHWLRTARYAARGRSFLGVPIRIQGTGFMFASPLVKDGWNYVTLTEDRAFTSQLICDGIQISYQHEAIFYDEQPTDIKVAMRQRIRWAKGHLQAFTETFKPLFIGIFTKRSLRKCFACYDMILTNFPRSAVTLIPKICLAVFSMIASIQASQNTAGVIAAVLWAILNYFFVSRLITIIMGFSIFIFERKRLVYIKWYKKILFAILYPVFDMIGTISTVIALFTDVTWKPIPHGEDISIDDITKNMK